MQVSHILRALPVVLSLAALQDAPAQTRFRIATNDAWLYNEPGGRRLARFARGTIVTGAATRDQWVQVTLDGWIFASSVGASTRPDFDLQVTRSPNENLRATPGGTIIAELARGFGLQQLAQDSARRWAHVTRTGWVQQSALTASAPDGVATRTTDTSAADTSRRAPAQGSRPGGTAVDSTRAQPVRMTTLYRAPDGPEAGTIAAETPLRVLSRNGEWARVQYEGWVKVAEIQSAPSGVLVGVTAAELRADPQRYAGQVVRWRVEFIAVQRADDLRPDIPSGATYVLARGPLPERGFVYIIVPDTRLVTVSALTPLTTISLTARVRNGRSRYLGNPVVELISLEEGMSP
jgi:hypothetical protein